TTESWQREDGGLWVAQQPDGGRGWARRRLRLNGERHAFAVTVDGSGGLWFSAPDAPCDTIHLPAGDYEVELRLEKTALSIRIGGFEPLQRAPACAVGWGVFSDEGLLSVGPVE